MPEIKPDHSLITSSRVTDTPVFNREGDRIGRIEDLSIDKLSGQVRYALLSFGGFLGIGERYHPLPWAVLDYDTTQDGYVLPLTKDELEKAPSYGKDELEGFGGGDQSYRDLLYAYYQPYGAVPYWP
ncbi:MAG: PRC-barrel domain-containing protein [Phenylobacterium sp.]|uniref:PRC-barrel domain-containing protein n=1 Tax=Phenylobacterium sp. TaxID=1871053 RepID=UPI002734ED7F|nr:PRC-barrel domain-containing protein [Phenylobacterium sp.]MDP3176090.1 PRC-barrel domain-containing protein [Phenylobacterium sp.]